MANRTWLAYCRIKATILKSLVRQRTGRETAPQTGARSIEIYNGRDIIERGFHRLTNQGASP